EQDVMLFTSGGKVIRFHERQVRSMGRGARGVRGILVPKNQRLISQIIPTGGCVLTATAKGYGKRTNVDEFRSQGRGGQGVIAMQTGARNGQLVSAILVNEDDEMMLITDAGTLVRTRVAEVSVLGRNTQGVKLISLSEAETLVVVEPIVDMEEGGDTPAEEE
ncbi:MAG: DNA gyrase C-terminal beta-propeller domain-containing protein, partial [Gammaproteobacteria bacterium]|nr:DNA gyrase C-terminal beta-propeller domain-containing protein [Gammaproteobacteria bacterium]